MNQTINILYRTWIRGPKKLKALQITLLFNNQEVKLEIRSRRQIKELVRFHFYILSKTTQYKLRQDLRREFRFNQKQCKRVIKINQQVKNIMIGYKKLLN